MTQKIDRDFSNRAYIGKYYVGWDGALMYIQWLEYNDHVQPSVCCTSKDATDWLVLHTNVPREVIAERLATNFQAWPRYRTWHSAKE
jgi:hypothetical protein